MIAFRRTASIAPGMFSSAMAFANEIKVQVKVTTGIDLQIALPIGGNPSRVSWLANYENLAQLDAMSVKLLSDPKYQELIKKAAGIIVPETTVDEIWRTI
ncbi:hypothetical protein KUL72_24870 [Bradyrhizobium arachidis]|uniref:hypothetical protein n=1 Tax=Bradyrhizobium arachidis TaxID=858423 RepID=UPI002163E5C5|nr:hypothetical protein [Bradyrhizobium arachidis]UVO34685.1 hypothetical protein KUL72_24870 [Bradyrhizobium arachidis]